MQVETEKENAVNIRAVKLLSLGALMAFVLVASAVTAQDDGTGGYGSDYGTMSGPGMMGGYGMMHGPGMMGGYGMMYSPGMMPGAGMMGGYGPMHGPGMMRVNPAWMPSLTNDQRDEIGNLRQDLHKQRWENMGRIMEQRQKLLELYSVESPDAKKIGAVYGEIFNLLRQTIEASIDARNRTRAVLTEEQRAQLDQWRRGWSAGYGGPGMMGPGMMGPGMMGQ